MALRTGLGLLTAARVLPAPLTLLRASSPSPKLLPSDLPVLIRLCDLNVAVGTGISVNVMGLFPAFCFHYLEGVCIKSGLTLSSTPQRAISCILLSFRKQHC